MSVGFLLSKVLFALWALPLASSFHPAFMPMKLAAAGSSQIHLTQYRRVVAAGSGARCVRMQAGEPDNAVPGAATGTPEEAQAVPENESKYWEWKQGWRVHYQQTGSEGTPLLMLPGFGVGGFHYQRNVPHLANEKTRVWVMDILGQGKSWPTQDPAPGGGFSEAGFEWGFGEAANDDVQANELTYSCTMWKEQIIAFLEQVVGEPCYLAGNSLGGYLSVMVASERPDLVKGLFLINPTPFWGVGAQRVLPWTGGYPVPRWVRPVTIRWWDTIRSPRTIKTLLEQVYADAGRVGDHLVRQIIEPTEYPAAASAFASILLSPPSPTPFDGMLAALHKAQLPVGLCYGKEDPWIVPLWGHRAKRTLPQAEYWRTLPQAEYWQISPAGHCPHHEAPEAFNFLLLDWLQRMQAGQQAPGLESKIEVPRDARWHSSSSDAP
eukprot:CAMPEP_0181345378 /NCGR_PEP_ID=MMETSP1101-20121128/32714_1 /TAXON_ID=46948 /ORGANISM="Rhodomonas abbreviata, Strain Caron Lab Isolate" /LENGTH=435 /DNA_ID=CAMNT_0023457323 /DNA_START=87 /DNA_END=1391 /DNA_ORIENTATION=+